MEIYSLRYTGNLLQKQASKNSREALTAHQESTDPRIERFTEHLDRATTQIHELTHRELREIAQSSFERGSIDLQTYQQLASELPMEAVDAQGRIVDLSTITDDTPFDFADYYRSQMIIARTTGDETSFSVMKSAVDFLEGA